MKAAELRDLSVEDLNDKLEELTAAQDSLVLAHAVSQIENPLQIRSNRKDIARILTELRKREFEA